ncbi:MAG: YfbK domain-containing protein, partial [Acidobacteriota bacterium]
RLRHKPPEGGASREHTHPLRFAEVPPMELASDDERLAAAAAGFAMLLRESAHRGSLTWRDVLGLAESAVGEDPHGYRRGFLDLIRRAAALAAAGFGESLPWRP